MRWLALGLLTVTVLVPVVHGKPEPEGANAAAVAGCPPGAHQLPAGARSHHIQQAIRRAGPGGIVKLAGDYRIDSTLVLQEGTTLCSDEGATLAWADRAQPGMMVSALNVSGTRVQGLVLDGRGIAVRGSHHSIEGNLIRNIQGDSTSEKRWGERHGILIVDQADRLVVRQNLFSGIVDTGVMGYNIHRSLIVSNSFHDLAEGIHVFSASHTHISNNTGARLRAMCIEIQGNHLPGLVVENNHFKSWHPNHVDKAYVMSVVAGRSAVVRGNVIEGSPGMSAGLEVGGEAPQVLNNTLIDASLVITDTPDALIKNNRIVRASIHKDVNRAKGGRLIVEGNTIEDAPRVGIFADEWGGYDQVVVRGNQITKTLTDHTVDFVGIVATPFRKQPLLISENVIRFTHSGRRRPIRAVCIANSGYMGNLKGMQIAGNTCDGAGVGLFGDSNSIGGHEGISYRNNRLLNLRNSITGDTRGLISQGNELSGVAADDARLGKP